MDRIWINGTFAQLILAELDADPPWERRCARLKRMFPAPEDREPRT
ncbi:MAG: hypothetical protein JWN84_4534 [Nocardioides sp.]|jgi:hypothetical protein|nr:hypothetical protein [Nocardioides sp.]